MNWAALVASLARENGGSEAGPVLGAACCDAADAEPGIRRTKNPYSGARIGPFSRSAARKEKLPELVHKVTMVRATSSGWLVKGWTRRHFGVPMYSRLNRSPRRPLPWPTDRHDPVSIVVVSSPSSRANPLTLPSYVSIRPL